MLEQIRQILIEDCLLEPDLPLILGVSGGPDSLCLMALLRQLGYTITIAYFDHRLRPVSTQEAAAVHDLSAKLQLPFVTNHADVASHARENSQSIEEAARNLRYSFLFEEAKRIGAQAVAVGHTADDQIETFLLNLIRGSGPAGLGGMDYRAVPNKWSEKIPLVRPILGIWRSEILEYIQMQNLQPLLDETNFDRRYMRNRVRLDLIPMLEGIHPGIRKRLWQTTEILSRENLLLESLTKDVLLCCDREIGGRSVSFKRDVFLTQPTALQRRIVRSMINELRPGLIDITFETIERAIDFVRVPSRSGYADLAANLDISLRADRVFLVEKGEQLLDINYPLLDPENDIVLSAPSEFMLANGWNVKIEILPFTVGQFDQSADNHDCWQAWLDADRVRTESQAAHQAAR